MATMYEPRKNTASRRAQNSSDESGASSATTGSGSTTVNDSSSATSHSSPIAARKIEIPRGTANDPARPVPEAHLLKSFKGVSRTWTNDTKQMDIKTYFSPEMSNLAMSYNVRGLQPVIRRIERGRDLYLLTDEYGNHYKWSPEEDQGGLYRLVGVTGMDEAVEGIVYFAMELDLERVGNNLREDC